jgi:putative membrane protein insertion efficiency factor
MALPAVDKSSKAFVAVVVMNCITSFKNVVGMPQGCCRFTPTCSHYAADCLATLPIHKALIFIVLRLIKCNPLSRGGYDPIPSQRKGSKA